MLGAVQIFVFFQFLFFNFFFGWELKLLVMSSEMQKLAREPSVVEIKKLKKSNLVLLGQEFGLELNVADKKWTLVNEILEHCIDEQLLASDTPLCQPSQAESATHRESELALELAKIKLEEQKLKTEEARIRANATGPPPAGDSNPRHYEKKHNLPEFSESDPERFFNHFQRVATSMNWPKEEWVKILQGRLRGKAQDIFINMPDDECFEYDKVRECILRAYEITPEAHRQVYRNLRPTHNQPLTEFVNDQIRLFDRWIRSAKAETYEALRNLILMEHFINMMPENVSQYIRGRIELNSKIGDLAKLAENYQLAGKRPNKNNYTPQSSKPYTHSQSRPAHSNPLPNAPSVSDITNPVKVSSPTAPKGEPKGNSVSNVSSPRRFCGHCNRPNHTISRCWQLHPEKRPNALVVTQGLRLSEGLGSKTSNPQWLDLLTPFLSKGRLLLSEGSSWKDVVIFRDTGAIQTLILESALQGANTLDTGEVVLVEGVTSDTRAVPLHKVTLESDFHKGVCTVGVTSYLPFPNVDVIVGNDLAGDKVGDSRLPIMLPTPKVCLDPPAAEDNVVYPACAVTRSMGLKCKGSPVLAKVVNPEVTRSFPSGENQVDLADTFMARLDDVAEDIVESLPPPSTESSGEVENTVEPRPMASDQGLDASLSELQKADPTLADCHETAVSMEEIVDAATGYYYNDRILMRKWRPQSAPLSNEWEVVHQVMLPTCYRERVLAAAHDDPMGGHQGINITYHKILKYFFWPKLKSDVAKFCNACIVCQLVGKPNQTPPKAPLRPIVVPEEPFSHVVMDCVGPLPRTKSGNIYLITMMCITTRYPEAFAVRNIRAKTVVARMLQFFSTFGLPRVVQTDNGTNFKSDVFEQFCKEHGITHKVSSPYHPQSQGVIERFHLTLKQMLKTSCESSHTFWDENLPYVLFAAREGLQSSLGCSPFELVFGHKVRGPLQMLQENLLGNVTLSEGSAFFAQHHQRLKDCKAAALKYLGKAQEKMKERNDAKSKLRVFQPGDPVLVLKPRLGNTMSHKYEGPYIVTEKTGDLTYKVRHSDKRNQVMLIHVNRLKKFQGPRPIALTNVSISSERGDDCSGDPTNLIFNNSSSVNAVEELSHLQMAQREEVQSLVDEFSSLFGEVPTQTDAICHDVELTDYTPIRLQPYRMSPEKKAIVRKEVDFLLQHGLIRPSQGSWCSPCLLVPKPDGSWRLCTDYRQLNKVTIVDAYPLPLLEDCIDELGNAKYVSKFDLSRGYYQIPLTERAKQLTAFVTPEGVFEYQVLPFGLRNAPATFQRLMNSLLAKVPNCRAYLDDIVLFDSNWADHIARLRQLFAILKRANLTLNAKKCHFGQGTVTYLGYEVGQGKVLPRQDKINAILEYPVLKSKKDVQRFIGMCAYYRRFCQNFSSVATPLTDLLRKAVKFKWSSDCAEAFKNLKLILASAPVLASPRFDRPFKIHVDASDSGAGAVLLQTGDDQVEHPVYYYSVKFDKAQRNYSVVEKEALALVLTCKKFEVYLTGNIVEVYTDHNPLVFLTQMKGKNKRILRWALYLQDFNLSITHLPGRLNVIADALSRLPE